jgi:hypothetical protein
LSQASLVVVELLASMEAKQGAGAAPRKKGKTRCNPGEFDLDSILQGKTDKEVWKLLRLTRASFDKLLGLLRPSLQNASTARATGGVQNAAGHTVTAEQRLVVAMRYFAGAKVEDIVEA